MDPTMSHAELEQLAAGYVLGALEPDDEQAFARHLDGCQLCQREVNQLEGVVGELAYAVPQVEPPRALRTAIRREVGLTRRRRGLLALRFPERPNLVPRVAVAFSLAAVLALGFWNFSLRNQLDLYQQRQTQIEQAVAIMATPGARQVALAPTDGGAQRAALFVRGDTTEATLLVWGLPNLPEGKVWQFWLLPPGAGREAAKPGRTWHSGDGVAAVPLGELGEITEAGFAVTDEPAGGSEHPTGTIVMRGKATA